MNSNPLISWTILQFCRPILKDKKIIKMMSTANTPSQIAHGTVIATLTLIRQAIVSWDFL